MPVRLRRGSAFSGGVLRVGVNAQRHGAAQRGVGRQAEAERQVRAAGMPAAQRCVGEGGMAGYRSPRPNASANVKCNAKLYYSWVEKL